MNLMKRIRIGETKQLEVRVDARNFLNTPYWANPDTNIKLTQFRENACIGLDRFKQCRYKFRRAVVYDQHKVEFLMAYTTIPCQRAVQRVG
jgi:hypothetical protein